VSNDGARRAVVFDFGGVIITPITNQLGGLAAEHGTTVATMLEIMLGPYASGDHPWHRAERGEIAVAEIQRDLDRFAEPHGVELVGDEIDRLLALGQFSVVEPVVERIAALRREGVLTGLLTNTFAEFRPILEEHLDLSLFDVVVESYAVGARKPEAAIYEVTASMLGVEHAAIVYLDDFEQNLAPAVALGWTVIHVRDSLAALDELTLRLSSN
jgi:epoxide hydrolase-like predicted phosphatase